MPQTVPPGPPSHRPPSHRLPSRRGDWQHAGRVALGLAVPGAALMLAGRPDLIIYAVFGSFTGMYGRGETRLARLRHQACGGAVIMAGASIGITLAAVDAGPWVLVACASLFAGAAGVVADGLGLRPQGPFFAVFALGALATVPAGRVAPVTAALLCAATALFSLLLGLLGRADATARHGPDPVPGRLALASAHAVRYAAAAAAAGAAGVVLGVDHANWAIASAIVPLSATDPGRHLRPGLASVARRGAHRVVGSLAGLVVAGALFDAGVDGGPAALTVMALLFPTELFMARNYGLALGFFTPLILMMTQLAAPSEPRSLVAFRAVDTVLGVAAGVLVAALASALASAQQRTTPKPASLYGPARVPRG
ncbi:FUSC family protein [Sinomonas halotolerans]|uniref:FUSC family protein n=1 Tax=Sinomonas halotolerans TaxID=1644133 RepID=A0ABU9X2S7_9MICC